MLYSQQLVFVMLFMLSASEIMMELISQADSQHNLYDKYLLLCKQY